MDSLQKYFVSNSPVQRNVLAPPDVTFESSKIILPSLQLSAKNENVTRYVEHGPIDDDDSSFSLAEEIRRVIFEELNVPDEAIDLNGVNDWTSSTFLQATEDLDVNDHLQLFTHQIDLKSKEIAVSASRLLSRLDFESSSTILIDINLGADNNVVEDISNVSQAHELHLIHQCNFSPNDGSSWLQDAENELMLIDSWEIEAKKLSLLALGAFRNLKQNTTGLSGAIVSQTLKALISNASGIHREIQLRHEGEKVLRKERSRQTLNLTLFDSDAWASGGFEIGDVIPPADALETLKSMHLKSYKLKGDKQRDLTVNKDERRTRVHIGAINTEVQQRNTAETENINKIEPATIFSYNVGAISQLANFTDLLISKLRTISKFAFKDSILIEKVLGIKSKAENTTQDESRFRSPNQLAYEVAALETEAALSRIAWLSHSIVQSTRVNLVQSMLLSRLKSLKAKDRSSERMSIIERDVMSTRDDYNEHMEASLNAIFIHINTLNQMKEMLESTKREIVEIDQMADTESRIAKETTLAEASVERENENSSLEQIQLLGKARLEEMMQAIETTFWHLARCLSHMIGNREGRQEFIFYAGAAALLVFVASTLKEVISLVFFFIFRFLTAPRLVREYGNWQRWFKFSSTNRDPMEDLVLPREIEERMKAITNIASAASARRFSLRNVLIYGNPGCGKSMAAKAMAQSVTNLPYALMSGADVFPMQSQGPAELRRLLTWAANKRRGGIIIIDEAESALASRSEAKREEPKLKILSSDDKSSSSAGFSRDCLNVLLSMTGSFGNIMLILTTTNPNKLDEAVLDRMDEIIHIPLPSQLERQIMLQNNVSVLFDQTVHESKFTLPRLWFSDVTAQFDDDFNLQNSILDLANDSTTKGFSGRELKKIVQAVLHRTYASENGILTDAIWKIEVKRFCQIRELRNSSKSLPS